jgi:hypothetical protein
MYYSKLALDANPKHDLKLRIWWILALAYRVYDDFANATLYYEYLLQY